MNIFLTSWQFCPDYDGQKWISHFQKYGVDYSQLLVLPSKDGLNQTERNLIFLFKEPNSIANITVIGYGNCYAFPDSTAGAFYTNIKKALDTEQFFIAVEIWNEDYALEVSKAIFDIDKPLSERKEAMENFLIEQYSSFILK